MFYDKHAKILITVVCAILGVMLATQFRTNETRKANIPYQRAEDLSERLKVVEKERNQLLLEIQRLQAKASDEVVAREINMLKAYAGDTALHGPGVIVTVDDSKKVSKPGENQNLYLIHDDDLLRIINELRASGAEGIAINEERLIAVSEIRCAGPTLSVNNSRFAPPYIIRAIGDPKSMETALKMRGGVIETLKFWGIQVTVSKEENVVIPAFRGTHTFEYAKVGEGGTE
ncbi:MAG: DUF881 domain-containing protein [Acholeplasmataceae bacterium]|nr:DUF881 domain-containing protein [Acholeplasmataceae bacterium]